LVNNALEAMDATIDRTRMLRVRTELRDRAAIVVSVQDSGPGIDPKQLDDIFGAFVTTKAHGMGLGLAICRMIIEHHGGQLSASRNAIHVRQHADCSMNTFLFLLWPCQPHFNSVKFSG
jgi:signal transduction histidine kinase